MPCEKIYRREKLVKPTESLKNVAFFYAFKRLIITEQMFILRVYVMSHLEIMIKTNVTQTQKWIPMETRLVSVHNQETVSSGNAKTRLVKNMKTTMSLNPTSQRQEKLLMLSIYNKLSSLNMKH